MKLHFAPNELQENLRRIAFVVEKSDYLLVRQENQRCVFYGTYPGISALIDIPMAGEGEAEICVGSRYVPLLLSLPKEVELYLDITPEALKVEGKGISYCIPKRTGVRTPNQEFRVDFTLPFNTLQEVLKTALRAVPKTVVLANRSLVDVALLETAERGIRVVVTDGTRLFVGEVQGDPPPFSMLLSREHLTMLTKVEDVSTVGVHLSQGEIILSFPHNFGCAITRVEMNFPDYRKVLDRSLEGACRVRVGTAELLNAVKRLELLGNVVDIEVTPDVMRLETKEDGTGAEEVSVMSNGATGFTIPISVLSTVLPVCPDTFVELYITDKASPVLLTTTQFRYLFAPIVQ